MQQARVVVIGGCGHVGLPLALAFADAGQPTASFDVSADAVSIVMSGRLPFMENGADEVLTRTLAAGTFHATQDPEVISQAEILVVVIGTPVDEHLNPDPDAVVSALMEVRPWMKNGQLVILRSTVFPGVTEKVEAILADSGVQVDVAFCPERIAEGHAMTELYSLPQIIGARGEDARVRSNEIFGVLGVETIDVLPEEAELAKLITNNWRYIKFAAANQFYVMANDRGLDYSRIHNAVTYNYPRAQDLPRPGFAAGPCLFKDTMQLGAFTNNTYVLGHSAMLVNEGLPLYVVDRMDARFDLASSTVGILGMAFKGESDDIRSSLSYKLKRILRFRAKSVLCSDPYVSVDPSLVPIEDVLQSADLIVIGAPHNEYRELKSSVPVIDVWNMQGNGVLI